jgi:glutathione S-transferase
MDTPLLWHIPLSHYSEKVRWALDYKGIAHRRRVLGPDYLIRVWRATGQGKLPVLWLDGRAIADSTRIIAALEEHYPEPALYPRDTAARQRALALEDDLDETLGPALRGAIMTPLFRHDPDTALRVLTTGMGGKAYRTLRPLLRIFPSFYRFRHSISESNLERDRPWRQSWLLGGSSIWLRFPPPLWPLRPPFRRSYNDLPMVVSPIRRSCRFLWALYRVFANLCGAPCRGSQLSSRRVLPLECERGNCLGPRFLASEVTCSVTRLN